MSHLQPVRAGICLFGQEYVHDQMMAFSMKEKIMSLTSDAFDVKDENGKIHYKMRGKFFTLHKRKLLEDGNGHELGELEHQILTLHRCIKIQDKKGKTLATAKTHAILQLHANVDVWLSDKDSGDPDVKIQGSVFSKEYTLKNKDEEVIAQVSRKIFTMRNFLTHNDTYALYVAANVDCALMVSLVVCLEEMFMYYKEGNRI